MADFDADVAIVGAGLAGLACATHLEAAGISTTIFEAGDAVGGRVRTDTVDGFTLDRGFQILLASYPELTRLGVIEDLYLARFDPGAVVRVDDKFCRVGDPYRQWTTALPTALAPIGSLSDKFKIVKLRRDVAHADPVALLRSTQRSTIEELERRRFSPRVIERFFRPLLSGIQLTPSLDGPAAMFLTIMRGLTVGDAGVPQAGMAALPALLAARLKNTAIHLGAGVASLTEAGFKLDDGRTVSARNVVIATHGPAAAKMTNLPEVGSNRVSALYFASDQPPTVATSRFSPKPRFSPTAIVLNGSGPLDGPVTNAAVMSNIAPSYAPPGRALTVAAIVGPLAADTEQATRAQLRRWFGGEVDRWETVAAYEIAHAQPAAGPPFQSHKPVRLTPGRYVCGDHRDTPSIQGALYSGRRAAAAIIADRRSNIVH